MAALTLKTYQAQALESLGRFLADAGRTGSLPTAWALEKERQAGGEAGSGIGVAPAAVAQAVPYRGDDFGPTPCVCLRIPTGGGKTLMAAHAIPLLARQWRQADFPFALWLVPSRPILQQTLSALNTPGHPCRLALEAAFGQRLAVLDLDATPTLAPQDTGHKAVVLVATIQSFRVRNTQGRNVYAFSEDFDPHFAYLRAVAPPAAFAGLEAVSQQDLDEPGQAVLGPGDLGRVKHSLANLLALTRPIVVVDEAHNATSRTSIDTLKRVAPSVVLELTATPVPRKANVLYSVTARELQAEDMIKLPVLLAEHAGWPDAVLRRRQLEAEAVHETRYVRPIVLFQAQNKTGDATAERLREHLLAEKLAAPEEIAVATGNERGLDGIDLFDPACPVRHVITVEALKEGWDCSFAYVLCSLQSVRSGKDVEQLLGRVLRMPYAARCKSPALNLAYAHVVATSFSEAASALADRMVRDMGFEAIDAATVLLPDPGPLPLFADEPQPAPRAVVLTLELPPQAALALADEPDLKLMPSADALTVQMAGEVSQALLERLHAALPNTLAPAQRAEQQQDIELRVQQHNLRVVAARCPAQQGVRFAPLPLLCLFPPGPQAELELFTRDTLDEVLGFDLLRADPQPDLPGFQSVRQSDMFEIRLDETRVRVRATDEDSQLSLDAVPTDATETDVVVWLTAALRRPELTDSALRQWTLLLVRQLLGSGSLTLPALVRAKHQVELRAQDRIASLMKQERTRAFARLMLPGAEPLAGDAWGLGLSPAWQFVWKPGQYPVRDPYVGNVVFKKHYFETIHGLRPRGEEEACARAIDDLREVKHWVRNIDRQERFSFWLPTATDYFYPDFVAELEDGRLLVVEYKGAHLVDNVDTGEKRAVGQAWARASDGQGIFVIVQKKLGDMDVRAQLRHAIGAAAR
jgi:type III restriction enzyme